MWYVHCTVYKQRRISLHRIYFQHEINWIYKTTHRRIEIFFYLTFMCKMCKMCKMFLFLHWPNWIQIKLSCLFGLFEIGLYNWVFIPFKVVPYECSVFNHFHKMLFAFDLLPPTDHFLIGSHFGDIRPHTLLIFTLHANISRNFVWECKILNQRSPSVSVCVCMW